MFYYMNQIVSTGRYLVVAANNTWSYVSITRIKEIVWSSQYIYLLNIVNMPKLPS